jgi:hypothetical protein
METDFRTANTNEGRETGSPHVLVEAGFSGRKTIELQVVFFGTVEFVCARKIEKEEGFI